MRIPNSIRWLLVVVVMAAMSATASAGVFISVNFGPPPLPVYVQPVCPAPGYIFTPGYWAYGPAGYFWVPGTWVLAPQPGLLWTPGYWGWGAGLYYWHPGYWGPTVGFYGGIPYGFGYTGVGYAGGYWRGREFYYNQTVNNVNVVNVHNVYNTTVINNTTTVNRVAYNGGPGGVVAQPTPAEMKAASETHIEPTAEQVQHQTMAQNNRQMLASVNQGKPSIAATAKAGDFEHAVAASRAGAPYRAPQAGAQAASRANSVPRPGNEGRPEATANTATRSDVPRPPSSYREAGTDRNENAARENSASRPDVPRPPSGSQPSSAYRGENNPRAGSTDRATNVPRPQSSSRTEQAPRQPSEAYRQTAPSHAGAPRPESEPRPEAGARPQAQSKPQGESRGERPSPDRPER